MPEILTESFCERCGTRYTFESAAPPKVKKLGRFKTQFKGLKNYVLSDETSMDEAMAAARSEEERELTSHHLDAFHSTFNFCMTCRQYTCANCWNQAEGACLTCAPLLAHEFPVTFLDQSPLVTQEPILVEPSAWPVSDALPSGSATTPLLDDAVATDGTAAAEPVDLADRLAQMLAPRVAADAPVEPVETEPTAWPIEAEHTAVAETDAIAAAEWEAAEMAAGADAESDAARTWTLDAAGWPVAAEPGADAEPDVATELEAASDPEWAAEPTTDAEPIVVEAVEAEAVEAEVVEAELMVVEALGAEAIDEEPIVVEALEAEAVEAEPIVDEPLDAVPIVVEAFDAEPVSAPTEFAAWVEADNEALAEAIAKAHRAAEATPSDATETVAIDEPATEGADLDARAALAASRTSDLLARLRPGENIDAELEAYEASVDTEPAPEEQQPAEPATVAPWVEATAEGLPPELVSVIGPAKEAETEPEVALVAKATEATEAPEVTLEVEAEAEPEVAAAAPWQEAPVEPLPADLVAVIGPAIEAAPEATVELVTEAPEQPEVAAEAAAELEVAETTWPDALVAAVPPELVAVIGPSIAAAPEPPVEIEAEVRAAEAPEQPEVAAVLEAAVLEQPEVAEALPAEVPAEVAAAPAAPEPAPVSPEPEPTPEPEPVRADVVEQPTWRIVAPDIKAPLMDGHPAPVPAPAPIAPAEPAVAATVITPPPAPVEPQWPVAPQLIQADPSFLANQRTAAAAATDAVWAASSRNVVDRPAGAPAAGVQTCSSCGLSLSATARFCRRCGNRQGV